MEDGGGAARPQQEKTSPPAPLTVLTADENEESPESPSQSSRELRAVARAFTAQYYRDMNTAPCLVRRYYTVRAPPNLTSILIVSPQNYGRKKTKICLAVKHKMFALGAGGAREGGG
jgi:hypothetical protein